MSFAFLAGLALCVPPNCLPPAQARPVAPKNVVYRLYYYNVKSQGRVHHYGTYTNYAHMLRALNYLNSFPEYRAYYVTSYQ
jgi:hypothetical protein